MKPEQLELAVDNTAKLLEAAEHVFHGAGMSGPDFAVEQFFAHAMSEPRDFKIRKDEELFLSDM